MNPILDNLSPEMRAYFISQTDPYHDTPYKLEGAPSSVDSSSLVLTVNTETTVDASTFLLPVTPGAKFDLHVVSVPISGPVTMMGCNIPYPGAVRNATSDFAFTREFGPLTIHGVASGETFSINNLSPNGQIISVPNNAPTVLVQGAGTGYTSRLLREIARAFEVIDVTPNLYKQGSVTTYALPSTNSIDSWETAPLAQSGGSFINTNISARACTGPPTTLEVASNIPGSQTWEASKGVYTCCRKNLEEIPFARGCTTPLIMQGLPEGAPPGAGQTNFSWIYNKAVVRGYSPTSGIHHAYFNTHGAYFSGLSSEFGTFRIRLRQIFEILPHPSDIDYVPLMTPTIPRDPGMEEIINQVLAITPHTVPQTFNPKGEQWKIVLRSLAKVGKELSPFVGSVSPELGVAVGALSNYTLRKTKTKANQNPKAKPKISGTPKKK